MNVPVQTDRHQTQAAIHRIESLLHARKLDAAAAEARRLTGTQPDCIEAWILLGRARQQSGAFAEALKAARNAAALDARDPGAGLLLAETLVQTGRPDEGLAALRGVEDAASNDGRVLQHVGQLYTHLGRHVEAAAAYARAAALEPANPQYLYNLATARIALGELAEAERLLDQVIARAPGDYDAYYNRSTLRKQTQSSNHIVELERVLSSPLRHPAGAVPLNYALAKESEDLGESEKSFAALKRGADARRRMLSYRVEDDIATIEQIARAFDVSVFAGAAAGYEDVRPTFVLGLPRSGTTLVERILSSHSQIESLGERNDFAMALVRAAGGANKDDLIRKSVALDFTELGRAYCASAAAGQGAAARLIDKTPVNFLYIGLIALALPNARIVHVRRNAMDVCYAMYKTLFRMAYPFSYDLGDLGRYYLAYLHLMEHWRSVLPGRILDIDYEELVRKQEPVSRRLVAHCGLDWEEVCLSFERNTSPSLTASAAQARQPIYRSSVDCGNAMRARSSPWRKSCVPAAFPWSRSDARGCIGHGVALPCGGHPRRCRNDLPRGFPERQDRWLARHGQRHRAPVALPGQHLLDARRQCRGCNRGLHGGLRQCLHLLLVRGARACRRRKMRR